MFVKRLQRFLAAITLSVVFFSTIGLSAGNATDLVTSTQGKTAIADPVLAKCIEKAVADANASSLAELEKLDCEADADNPQIISDYTGLDQLVKVAEMKLTNFSVDIDQTETAFQEDEKYPFPPLPELKKLTLVNFGQLPDNFDGLTKLEQLVLEGGEFTKIPNLSNLTTLKTIEVIGRPDLKIDKTLLPATTTLKIRDGAYIQSNKAENQSRESAASTHESNHLTSKHSKTGVDQKRVLLGERSSQPSTAATPVGQSPASTPAPTDVMPDGKLKESLGWWDKEYTYENVQQVTSLNIASWRVNNQMTVSDWAGANFLTGVKKLTISSLSNGLEIPEVGLTGLFPNLQTIEITDCGLTKVPNLGESNKVTKLNLSKNQLTEFPSDLKFPKLSRIDLTSNKLTQINIGPNYLKWMMFIEAANNQITGVNIEGKKMFGKTLTSINLRQNAISSITNIKSSRGVEQLNVRENRLTNLTGFPELFDESGTEANLSQNQIGNVSELEKLTDRGSAAIINIKDQKVAGPDVEATKAYRLDKLLTLPDPDSEGNDWAIELPITWQPGEIANMPAINPETGNYTAAKAGQWSVGFNSKWGVIEYSGNVSGSATGEKEIKLELTGPEPLAYEGKPAKFTASYSGDVEVLEYVWYKQSAQSGWNVQREKLENANSNEFTISETSLSDAGWYVVEVKTDAGIFSSELLELNIKPFFKDANFEKCVSKAIGKTDFSAKELKEVNSLICPSMGISSIEDMKLMTDSFREAIDLSGNQIVDISPLKTDRGIKATKVNLANNLISDVTPIGLNNIWGLGWADLNEPDGKGIRLDGNRIQNVSSLSNIDLPSTDSGKVAISVADQTITYPTLKVGESMDIPELFGMSNQNVTDLNVTGGSLSGNKITFSEIGEQTIKWSLPVEDGVLFNGMITVNVVDEGTVINPEVSLDTTPADKAIGGHLVKFRAKNFAPNSKVVFKFDDQEFATALTDIGGSVTVSKELPYGEDQHTVTVNGEDGKTAELTVKQVDDTKVDVPDKGLASCMRATLGLSEEETLYATRLAKITGTFNCGGKEIKDLTGITAISANKINVSNNQIIDFSPVKDFNGEVIAVGQELSQAGIKGSLVPLPKVIAPEGQEATYILPQTGVTRTDYSLTWENTGKSVVYYQLFVDGKLTTTGTINYEIFDPAEPTVTVAPNNLYPGDLANIVAYGLTPGESVSVVLTPGNQLIKAGQADSLGVYTVEKYEVPRNLAPGVYELVILGGDGTKKTSVELRVEGFDAETLISPNELYAGQRLNLVATGFIPGETVRIEMQSEPVVLGYAIADADGFVSVENLDIPQTATVGVHKIVTTGLTSGITSSTDLKVLPWAAPASNKPGMLNIDSLKKVLTGQQQTVTQGTQQASGLPRTGEFGVAPSAIAKDNQNYAGLIAAFGLAVLAVAYRIRREGR